MIPCQHCENWEIPNSAKFLTTIFDPNGDAVSTFNQIPLCEDHYEAAEAAVQMMNLNKPPFGDLYTITHKRIEA